MINNMKKALTLVELMVASSLLLVVILGVFGIDTVSRNYYRSSQRKAQISAQLDYAVNHMEKYISKTKGKAAKGNAAKAFHPVVIDSLNKSFDFYVDTNVPETPYVLSDDTLMRYSYDLNRRAIYYCDNWSGTACAGNVEYLAEGYVDNANFSAFKNNPENVPSALNLHLISRFVPGVDPQEKDLRDNPKYELKINLFFGEYSLS